MAFFHNLIVIRKGSNDERCNVPRLIEREMEAAGDSASVSREPSVGQAIHFAMFLRSGRRAISLWPVSLLHLVKFGRMHGRLRSGFPWRALDMIPVHGDFGGL